ncbi:hypothetical protein KAFR_0E00730 [Kazachstania africana CBS 2517]|uniref:Uncharacterized protein n=1 Tax=Kazachstania africana (strain ATCC 22294 / BCRC 22015 / CBS 2517 / CECT 1963 / NBRC 1671 / NRRL Y-8276) TaxID=1071382 RepID=H2AV27_KAZAF|nr:hypothetical protein KAFR_0E00730 [Kazachstania africana CBS 2517]CCF58227.1 hypothetical protein KAFR_0E00730 [Kazachstania africana CBS 2517]
MNKILITSNLSRISGHFVIKNANTYRYIASKPSVIRSLEDLSKLESLDGVGPKLIKRLIEKRTEELNIKNELEVLKKFQNEEGEVRKLSLRKFTRPAWILLIMSSTVFLCCKYLWCQLEYNQREQEYQQEVAKLEKELNLLMNQENDRENNKKWYRRWF